MEVGAISPNPLLAGQRATITATPMSEAWDSRITLGSTSVLAEDLNRINCEACDSCRERYECLDCFDCDSCDAICKSTCSEQLTFQVPDTLAGSYPLSLINRFGQSASTDVVITASTLDTGASDTAVE